MTASNYLFSQDYRGWNLSLIQDTVPAEIHYPEWFDKVNDTRRGYLNEEGFMDELLFNMSYNPDGLSAPISQAGPALLDASLLKMDLLANPIFKKEMIASLEYDVPVVSEPMDLEFLLQHINSTEQADGLRSFTLDIIKEDFREDSKPVGFILGVVPWGAFFKNTLPAGVDGVVVVIESDCGGLYTYIINGGDKQDLTYTGDVHDVKYDDLEYHTKFFWKSHHKGVSRHCHFDLAIYPSTEFESNYTNNTPFIVGGTVAIAIIVAGVLIWIATRVIGRKQQQMQDKAARAEAIVASVFPKEFGERLIAEASRTPRASDNSRGLLKSFLDSGHQDLHSKPIADLFPSTTVIFVSIAVSCSRKTLGKSSVPMLSLPYTAIPIRLILLDSPHGRAHAILQTFSVSWKLFTVNSTDWPSVVVFTKWRPSEIVMLRWSDFPNPVWITLWLPHGLRPIF